MEIERFRCYKAKINYHRTDDLREEALPDGTETIFQASWIADEDENFAGEWIFCPPSGLWIPERDLIIIEEVDVTEYFKLIKLNR